jgi:hypothetical protein
VPSEALVIVGRGLPEGSVIIGALGAPIASIGLNGTVSTLLRTLF